MNAVEVRKSLWDTIQCVSSDFYYTLTKLRLRLNSFLIFNNVRVTEDYVSLRSRPIDALEKSKYTGFNRLTICTEYLWLSHKRLIFGNSRSHVDSRPAPCLEWQRLTLAHFYLRSGHLFRCSWRRARRKEPFRLSDDILLRSLVSEVIGSIIGLHCTLLCKWYIQRWLFILSFHGLFMIERLLRGRW